ncbi:putative RWP-RK domain-containing protein [Phytophthora cinnamomi]|uniref:putative RWP-RK domain-containing protein n=1 Tax=Phytophthora cinnamomi TaxID=4785 RepID=UPI00355AC05C|nr:putative RWP-RK domain-containing protein [Phytophthora cinnamomi]
MEAFALPRDTAIVAMAAGSAELQPLVHKRQLSDATTTAGSSPVKRRRLPEPVSPPGSPMSTSSVETAKTRPNMTASSSITLDMLRPHFEEPLAKVAANFGICVTLLKKICRRHGIARWPHRQITGLRKSIASMEHAIGYFDGDRRESYAEQLLKQKNKLAALLEDPTTSNPLLASDDDRRDEVVRSRAKAPPVQPEGTFEVPPASVTRASSPTGPLLVESPYYGASSAAMPTQTSPMWLSAAHHSEPSYTQKYHQLCPLSKLQQIRPEIYPTSSYYVTDAATSSGGVSSPPIYLPPLRRETRSVLPPISSLVVSSIQPPAPTSTW